MEEGSPEYPSDALGTSWDQVDYPQLDPWQTPGGVPWRPVAATRSQFLEIEMRHDALKFDRFETQWTLNRSDLALLDVPGAGVG